NYALRKNGLQEITPIHPELAEPLKDILDTTYGLIIYQEQVMSIAQKVAGFSLGQADILRRAMGKKKKEELDKQYEGFSGGMHDRGFSDAAVKALWDILLPFSDYAFNKAHSAAYGVVSYWTAYLKAHYPAEYMAALLTSVGDKKDQLALYLNECRRMGIKVLPPSVSESFANFAAVGGDIRFGMGAIRNVGTNVVEGIRSARENGGDFVSFHDFLKRVPMPVLNKRTIESLIKAGAFDGLGATRRALLEIHEGAVEGSVKEKRDAESGNVGFDFDSLFAEAAEADTSGEAASHSLVPDRPEWSKKDKLAFEREMLGLYVSDHPLRGLESALAKEASTTIEHATNPDAGTD
ncbi:MAG: DNA polymerase III subunit alpha, partial [Actinobacteria bacterium]|nr:DNA polymerase III subunit alpha [Actinomycetota bacterium]